MKSPRILTASLALAFAPFLGGTISTPAHAADIVAQVSVPESVYGLASRLPKDTEGFGALYRLRPLVESFLQSNFVKKLKSHEMIAREFDLDDIERALEDPQFRQYAELAADVLGTELTVVMPAGFTDRFTALLKQLPMIQAGMLFSMRAGAITPDGQVQRQGPPPEMQKMMVEFAEAVSNLEVPPVMFSLKAGKHKDMLQSLIGQGLNEIPGEVTDKLEEGKFETGGASFTSYTVRIGKVMDEGDREDMERELSEALGDKEKGTALAKKLQAKSVEIAWGWLDDYLILSIGPDHSHVKFATAADSVLTHPDVAPRAAQFAAKQPIAFSYTSQKTLRAVHELGGVLDMLINFAGLAQKAGAPVNLENVIKELQGLDAKADALWPNDADAAVGALWWDGGLRAESFGGPKPRGLDSSKPLSLPSLANDKTFLMLAGRNDSAFSDKVWHFFEEAGVSLYAIYQKDVKGMMPEDVRQGAAIGEAVGLPMIKEVWRSVQSFRAAMGTESAFLLNLDGAMPEIPGSPIPPDVVAKGRVPRLAWVSELKDRAKLTESWSGLKSIISSAAALIGSQTDLKLKTEPVERTEGNVTMFGYELPMNLGDLWPHAAVTPTQYFLSTSPSFTKELAAKAPAAVSPALGMKAQANFPALWDLGAHWAGLVPTGPEESEMIQFALGLLRCIGSLDVQCGEAEGKAHSTLSWKFKDAE